MSGIIIGFVLGFFMIRICLKNYSKKKHRAAIRTRQKVHDESWQSIIEAQPTWG